MSQSGGRWEFVDVPEVSTETEEVPVEKTVVVTRVIDGVPTNVTERVVEMQAIAVQKTRMVRKRVWVPDDAASSSDAQRYATPTEGRASQLARGVEDVALAYVAIGGASVVLNGAVLASTPAIAPAALGTQALTVTVLVMPLALVSAAGALSARGQEKSRKAIRSALLLLAVLIVPFLAPLGEFVAAWLQPFVGDWSLPPLHPSFRAYLEDVYAWYQRMSSLVGIVEFMIGAVVGIGLLTRIFWRRA